MKKEFITRDSALQIRPVEQRMIAERCAFDYHRKHEHLQTWPLTFTLHATENGPEIARVLVEREFVPEFYAVVVREYNHEKL